MANKYIVTDDKVIAADSITPVLLEAGASDFRAVELGDNFVTFAVRPDVLVGVGAPADGSGIAVQTRLVGSQGRWWIVVVLENQTELLTNVVVKAKTI